jgi:DNA-binding NarL/FixJ family response regulator
MIQSVAIIEDDVLLAEDLARMIRSQNPACQVDTFANAGVACRALYRSGPTLAIVDLQLPGGDGISLIRTLNHWHPTTRFVVYSVLDDPETVFRALEAGASGYIIKHSTAPDILEAINLAAQGGTPVSGPVARHLVSYFNKRGNSTREELTLTPRESEVLDLLSMGYRAKEVAARLGVGIDTVNTHIRHIYNKLHVSSRSEAIAKRFRSHIAAPQGA